MGDEEYSKDEVITEAEVDGEHITDPQAADEHTTEPQDTKAAKWEMPKPVFQQTSGYLPQGYVKQIEEVGTDDAVEAPPTVRAPSPAPQEPPAEIEPQPDLSEQLVMEDPAGDTPAVARTKSSSVRIPVIIIGVLGILAFLTVFLLAVWFLFLAEPGAGYNF